MLGKAALLVGLAAGYVLGARDGHERYLQIKNQANRIVQDPRVQQKATQAADLAKAKAPGLKDTVAGAASKAGSTVSGGDGTTRDAGSATGSPSSMTSTPPSPPSTPTTTPTTTLADDAIIVTAPPPAPLDDVLGGPSGTGGVEGRTGSAHG